MQFSQPPEWITTLAEIKARDIDGLALPTSYFAITAHRDRHYLLIHIDNLEARIIDLQRDLHA